MKKTIVLVMILAVILPLLALNVGGVILPDKMTLGKETLVLNGGGLRKKLIIKVYAGGLYLPAKSNNSAKILADTGAIAFRMNFIYKEVSKDQLVDAWTEGFINSNFEKKYAVEIAKFNKLFSEPAKKGDIYDITYQPGIGVQVIKNNKVLGTIDNPGFRAAVFSIWLGEKTALPELKSALLGK
jgi:hypothetical protein